MTQTVATETGATRGHTSNVRPLLVSVGEASGDSMARSVLSHLEAPSFGLTGPALSRGGCHSVADVTGGAAMGLFDAVAHAPAIARATNRLLRRARRDRPHAALLVGFSEVNAHIGVRLRKLGTRVLWLAPPQVWAWRERRIFSLRHSADAVACVLPFEEAIWEQAGVAANYVGHPALDMQLLPRETARQSLQLTPYAEVAALLPGSRSAEVRRMLPCMLEAVGELRAERGAFDARILLAATLPRKVSDWAEREGQRLGVASTRLSAQPLLSAFDVALVASGTATLECALANVPPVIVYRTGSFTEVVARRLVTVDHIGLPNLVLGRRAFPELIQDDLTGAALALAAGRLLDEKVRYTRSIAELRATLQPRSEMISLGSTSARRVAALMQPWLKQ